MFLLLLLLNSSLGFHAHAIFDLGHQFIISSYKLLVISATFLIARKDSIKSVKTQLTLEEEKTELRTPFFSGFLTMWGPQWQSATHDDSPGRICTEFA